MLPVLVREILVMSEPLGVSDVWKSWNSTNLSMTPNTLGPIPKWHCVITQSGSQKPLPALAQSSTHDKKYPIS